MELHDTPEGRIQVRAAHPGDLDRLVVVHATAFPDGRNALARRRNFTENVRGGLGDLRVAELDSQIVGHGFLFSMKTWLAGRPTEIAGVSSLGVAADARRKGVAHALLAAMLEELRDQGTPLVLLYPFKHGFYRELGFGLVCDVHRLCLPPSALPPAPGAMQLQGGAGESFLRPLKRCYERTAQRSNGMLARPESVWRALLLSEDKHVVVVHGARQPVRGYMIYTYHRHPPQASYSIDVLELVAEDGAARRELLGYLHDQRDQIDTVRIVTHGRDPLFALLGEPRTPGGSSIHSLIPVAGEVGAGPMLRIVDLERALRARNYPTDGKLTVRVSDDSLPTSFSTRTLEVKNGRPEVHSAPSAKSLNTDIATFAQILTGYLRPTDAVDLGLARSDHPATAQLADRMFACPPFFPLDVF